MTRQYAERLIGDAILHGDKHKHTFEMATWWLDGDKGVMHKLFKVIIVITKRVLIGFKIHLIGFSAEVSELHHIVHQADEGAGRAHAHKDEDRGRAQGEPFPGPGVPQFKAE